MPQHILSIKQFLDKDQLNFLFDRATYLQSLPRRKYPASLDTRVVATLFYEPSTRTRLSFESAILRLGGKVLSTENALVNSSTVKGERLEDTIKVVGGYADAIIIRHKEPDAAKRASVVSSVPIINAGDGGNEHPTQALLDLYTILRLKSSVDGLTIGLAGDLLHSRTIHSLLYLLALYKVELYLISSPQYKLPQKYIEYLEGHNVRFRTEEDMTQCLPELDVLYINRMQVERHTTARKAKPPKFTTKHVTFLKPDAIILDPLPRVDEIESGVDNSQQASYFQQAHNGLFIRMALLELVLE
jgi:aspartate carbamoyltransferase catalytic subunit